MTLNINQNKNSIPLNYSSRKIVELNENKTYEAFVYFLDHLQNKVERPG